MLYLLYNNKYLYDVIDSVLYVLMYYNIKCELIDEICYDERMYIIFTINKIEKLPKNYIVYNFEQLVSSREWSESFFSKCSKAKLILDYSLENIKIFKNNGLDAIHFPYGWTPFHEYNGLIGNKDIDIIFLGSKSERRDSILNSYGNSIYYRDSIFGEQYDDIVNRSKISLNIHNYDGSSILEVTRIVPLVSRGVLVVSERSDDKYYDDRMEGVIIYIDNLEKLDLCELKSLYDKNKCLRRKSLLLDRLNMVELNKDKINILKYI